MVFASSRDALKRALDGIAIELQGTDFGEVSHEVGESRSFPFIFFAFVSVGVMGALLSCWIHTTYTRTRADMGNNRLV